MTTLFPEFTPDQKLLALSWKQPYGHLMLHGKIETRSWYTKYRGWVLMCASQQAFSRPKVLELSDYLYDYIEELCGYKWRETINGYAFAIGRLADCRKMRPEDEKMAFVLYSPDRYVHIYESVQAIHPIYWRGGQGFIEVPPDIKRDIPRLIKASCRLIE